MATIDELQAQVRDFCDERDWRQFHTPKELAIGMVTEASELLEIFRFQNDAQMQALLADDKTRAHVADELADTFNFLLRFADLYGFDLTECLTAKLAKNAERYPVETFRGNNEKAPHHE